MIFQALSVVLFEFCQMIFYSLIFLLGYIEKILNVLQLNILYVIEKNFFLIFKYIFFKYIYFNYEIKKYFPRIPYRK